jgi:hypothetical protein
MLHITPDGKLHDDADGFALNLPTWPKDARKATKAEIDAINNPQETPEQIIARLEGALDRHLDKTANDYRYESIRTMVTYATSEHPIFGAEGRAAVAYRDAVYAYGIQCITDVNAGLRTIPTEAELIDELPPFTDFIQAA